MIGLILAATLSAGDTALKNGDFATAYTEYSKANKADEKDGDALLGLGTMYLYRNKLDSAKLYLTLADMTMPNDPRVKARLATIAEREQNQTDLTTSDIHVKFVALDPLPLVHVTVNGKELTFFLDTGAPSIEIAPDTAAKLGLKLVAAGEGTFAGGMTAQMHRTEIASFSMGGATLKNVDVGVLPRSGEMGGFHIDGAIGTGFLSRFLATIDYKHQELVLRPRSSSNAFLAEAKAGGASIVPMWLVGDHFLFARAHVNNSSDALFNIDTGGGGLGVQLTKAQLDEAKIATTSQAGDFTGGGGAAKALPFTAPSVTIGTVTKSNVPGLYFPDGDQFKIFPFAVAGTISHEFFKGSTLTFDFVSMNMIVGT